MDIDELRSFLAVIETGSMARAARSLGFARATLMRRIDELEARVGVSLLERTPAGVRPTPAGQVMAERGKHVLHEASALLSMVRRARPDPIGMLHVTIFVGAPPEILALATRWLREQHPDLTFALQFSAAPLNEGLEGVDVVLYFGEENATPGEAWTARTLRSVPQRLLASPAYLAARGTPRTVDELQGHDILLWQSPGPPVRRMSLGGALVPVDPVVVAPDIHLLLAMARAGLGIAVVPEGGLIALGPGQLVTVLPDEVGPTYALRLAAPRALASLPRVQAILSAVEATKKFFRG